MGLSRARHAIPADVGLKVEAVVEGRAEPVTLDPLPPAREPVASVYVHAPFCARRCCYCDFAVQVRRSGGHEAWIEAVDGELEALYREGRFPLSERLRTLYVGGGTPSLLGPGAMAALAGVLGPERLGEEGLEWTAEANPESFTPDVADAWVRAGVTRVSLGVQSFQSEALRWMGRLHGAEGAERAVRVAREAGLEDLSIDLIFGLPETLARSWSRDLERAVELDVPHLSLYGLTVEPGTPLGRAVAEGRTEVATEPRYREEFLEASERLRRAGYHHYEVSNFARPGRASRHNLAYWDGTSYLGLGNGAHSYRHPLRRWNLRDWDAYSTETREARLPVDGEELLSDEAHRLERLWLGLRTRRGVSAASLSPRARSRAEAWRARGLAEADPDALRLTPEGWLIMDRLAVEIDGLL